MLSRGAVHGGEMPGKKELRSWIAEIRGRHVQASVNTKSSFWTRKDRMFNGAGKVCYAILDTGGCRWALETGGCSMCGFANDSCSRQVSPEEIEKQVDDLVSRVSEIKESFGLKIFTSGSFFDDREIDGESRNRVYSKISKIVNLSEFTVESRPEHISNESIRNLVDMLPDADTEVAIGLESSSDKVREKCIGKGFSYEDFVKASKTIRKNGSRCKAYILLKPPFLSEFDAAYDSIHSMIDAAEMVDVYSLNATNVQRGTLVEDMYRSGDYRPPWIWTVRKVLAEAHARIVDVDIICDTVAFGTRRGPHNCRRCNKTARARINRFSLTQDPSSLEFPNCRCMDEWEREFNYHF